MNAIGQIGGSRMKLPDWKTMLPQKLKYRLFGAFLGLILLPFSVLNVYNYRQIESMVEEKISQQSHEQLVQMYGTLEDQMSIAFKTLIFLEQDSVVRNVLTKPGSTVQAAVQLTSSAAGRNPAQSAGPGN